MQKAGRGSFTKCKTMKRIQVNRIIYRWAVILFCLLLACPFIKGGKDENGLISDMQTLEIESRMLQFLDYLHTLSEDIPKYSMEEELATADKSLMMMDVKWNAYYGSWQNVIADNDSLLQIVADYQLIKQNIQDSISAKRHYIQSLEDFTVAETFLSAQDSVYEKFHTDALEYSLIKQLAPHLEQLKGKEQILFAEIQEHYEKAKAAAEEFNELQPRINKIEQRYIDLKNTSDKIQALEYKPWFQRIKDYLFGLAAVSMILLFVNALQSKIQMLKQTRENAKKLKQMQNKEEDDYPSI